jgi:HAD superfamily hydrolase (TIGR01509 family)
MTLKLVIFDCDGVLVDTEPLAAEVLSESLTQNGLPMSKSAVMDMFIGGTMLGVRDEALRLGARLPEDWIDEIYRLMFARLDQGVELIPGVLDVIERVEVAGIAKAIASNGPVEKMRRSLGATGLWDRFDGTIHSREDHAPKPAPDMLLYAMQMVGAERHETVMIDDSTSGCRAARNAGVRCLGFATMGQGSLLAAEGAEVATSMEDILTLLQI